MAKPPKGTVYSVGKGWVTSTTPYIELQDIVQVKTPDTWTHTFDLESPAEVGQGDVKVTSVTFEIEVTKSNAQRLREFISWLLYGDRAN